MVYCKKCARLLDEDVRFCPYCHQEDENFTEETDLMDRLRQIDEKIAQNQPSVETPAFSGFESLSEAQSAEPDNHTGITAPPLAPEPPSSDAVLPAEPPAHAASPGFDKPRPNTGASSGYTDARRVTVETSRVGRVPPKGASDAPPPTGLYVGLILLAVFMALPGMIAGIVYMTNANAAYRKMGLVVLLVSIGVILLGVIACCGLVYAIDAYAAAETVMESFLY